MSYRAEADREIRAQRYRAGLCVDCGMVPYSAGRPRCNTCHRIHARWIPGGKDGRKDVQADTTG